YLALTTAKPVVLSRPQLLVSHLDIIAEVTDPDREVVVEEVLFVEDGEPRPEVGDKLRVANLRLCKRLPQSNEQPEGVPLDWTGPGRYLPPLQPRGDGQSAIVVAIPPSPGFPPGEPGGIGPPRIYPDTPEVREQYRQLRKAGSD